MSASKHLKKVKRQMYKNLFAAYCGWWSWKKIIKRKEVSNRTVILLLPSCDREVNYFALLHLDELLKKRNFDNALILSHDGAVKKSAALFSDKILDVIEYSRKNAENLMQFYCLYDFDRRFIVASLDEPTGRNASRLIGKRGTTKEELLVIGVYRVYPFKRLQTPLYHGDDVEIIGFLKGRE